MTFALHQCFVSSKAMSKKVFISLVTISVTQPGHITFAAPNCKQLWLCCLFADAQAFAAADGAACMIIAAQGSYAAHAADLSLLHMLR